MKKTFVALGVLIVLGTFAYFGGYYLYMSENPKTETAEQISLQRAMQMSDTDSTVEQQEYYIVKIEQEMLMVYKMPEEILYDSVETSSLHFQEKEQSQLSEGIVFPNLTEVFEFLENSMS